MAMFVNSLRERGLAPTEDQSAQTPNPMQLETSAEISPLPSPKQFESTSVDVPPVPSAKQFESTSVDMPKAPAAPTDAQMQSTLVDVAPLNIPLPTVTPIPRPDKTAKPIGATARDLAAMPKNLDAKDDFKPVDLDAPAKKNDIAELRDSIKQDDWRPVTGKTTRKADPNFAKGLEKEGFKPQEPKPKPQPGDAARHLTLEEMAQLEDPDLALQQSSPQQQTIRQFKGKTTAGVRFELYLLIYVVCLGLSWLTEQSAMSGTCRDAGQRIQSAIQVITPKPLADNFIAGVNAYDDKEIKLHPFNPKAPPSAVQVIMRKCGGFASGLGSAFGRIPGAMAAAGNNLIAETLILLAYASVSIISILIYFKFRRSMQYGIADVMLLPICLLAAFSGISAVFTAVLSMSESLAAGYIPNTIVVFTTLTIIISSLDMARRSFLRRKQNITGRD